MSALERIAYFQNRRDEVPNQELARELAQNQNQEGIREIAENLWNKDPNVRSDCLKVLYEIGYLAPELIAGYVEDFLKLLSSHNNRMIWGSMIALSTVADLKAGEIFSHLKEIKRAISKGSVITIDNGIKTLAIIASKNEAHHQVIWPYLLEHLETCRPKDVPQHAEKIFMAVNTESRKAFVAVLEKRLVDLSDSQNKRVRKLIWRAEG